MVDRQYEHVKLHATLMNSLFAIKEEEEGNRETFNAKPILKVLRLTVVLVMNNCIFL